MNQRPMDDLIDRDQLVMAIREVTRAQGRNRKKRMKTLTSILDYLGGIIPCAYETDKTREVERLAELMDDLTGLLILVVKLLLSLTDQISNTDNLRVEMLTLSRILQALLLQLKTLYEVQDEETLSPLFQLTEKLMTNMIQVIVETESWRFVDLLYCPVAMIFRMWSENSSEQQKSSWANSVRRFMGSLDGHIIRCGDFACQYFLIIILQQWMAWVDNAEEFMANAFRQASNPPRQILLDNKIQDYDVKARLFLNSLNSTIRSSRIISSIECLCFFAGDYQIQCPKDTKFWIDFSVLSQRIHVFFSTPRNEWINLSISCDQMDSLCVSWVRKNEYNTEVTQTQTQCSTQLSRINNLDCDALIFLHILLNENFDELSPDLGEFRGSNTRELFLVFKEVGEIEKILHQMSFSTHPNGEDCIRPKKLTDIINGMSGNPTAAFSDGDLMADDVVETGSAFYLPCSSSFDSDENKGKGNQGWSSDEENDGISRVSATKSSMLNMTMESLMEDPVPRSFRTLCRAPPETINSPNPMNGAQEEPDERRILHSTPYHSQLQFDTIDDEPMTPTSPMDLEIFRGELQQQQVYFATPSRLSSAIAQKSGSENEIIPPKQVKSKTAVTQKKPVPATPATLSSANAQNSGSEDEVLPPKLVKAKKAAIQKKPDLATPAAFNSEIALVSGSDDEIVPPIEVMPPKLVEAKEAVTQKKPDLPKPAFNSEIALSSDSEDEPMEVVPPKPVKAKTAVTRKKPDPATPARFDSEIALFSDSEDEVVPPKLFKAKTAVTRKKPDPVTPARFDSEIALFSDSEDEVVPPKLFKAKTAVTRKKPDPATPARFDSEIALFSDSDDELVPPKPVKAKTAVTRKKRDPVTSSNTNKTTKAPTQKRNARVPRNPQKTKSKKGTPAIALFADCDDEPMEMIPPKLVKAKLADTRKKRDPVASSNNNTEKVLTQQKEARVPCYRKTPKPSVEEDDDFVDPYDLMTYRHFLFGPLPKTYKRKPRSAPKRTSPPAGLFLPVPDLPDTPKNRLRAPKRKVSKVLTPKMAASTLQSDPAPLNTTKKRHRAPKRKVSKVAAPKLVPTTLQIQPAPSPPRTTRKSPKAVVSNLDETFDWDQLDEESDEENRLAPLNTTKKSPRAPKRKVSKVAAPKLVPTTLQLQPGPAPQPVNTARKSPKAVVSNLDETFDWDQLDEESDEDSRPAPLNTAKKSPRALKRKVLEVAAPKLAATPLQLQPGPSPPRTTRKSPKAVVSNLDETFDWGQLDEESDEDSGSVKQVQVSRPNNVSNPEETFDWGQLDEGSCSQQEDLTSKENQTHQQETPLDDTFDWDNLDLD